MHWNLKKVANRDRKDDANFLAKEAPKLHDGFGGSSEYDAVKGVFVEAKPYRHLEVALKEYVPYNLGIQFPDGAWDELFDKLSGTESGYQDQKRTARRLFWWNIGERKEHIMPWVALIPDAYGLSVVKASIALVLKLAEDSVEKRDRIFNAFATLRDTLQDAMSKRKSFRTDSHVGACADNLYFTLVEAIEDLILFAAPAKSSWRRWIPRFEHDPDPQDPDQILRRVSEKTAALEQAVSQSRDEKLINTERLSKHTNAQMTFVRHDVKSTEINTREALTKLNAQGEVLGGVDENVLHIRNVHGEVLDRVDESVLHMRSGMKQEKRANDEFRNWMVKNQHRQNKIIRENERNMMARQVQQERNMMSGQVQSRNELLLMYELLRQEYQSVRDVLEEVKSQAVRSHAVQRVAVVSAERLVEILASPIHVNGDPHALETLLNQPSDDLERTLFQRNRFKPSVQAQAQSLLRYGRFKQWLGQHHPDMISVEGNMASAALDRLSVMSVFCATLAVATMKVKSTDVVIHFFCGLHTSVNDNWSGPNGLVRSLLVQVLTALLNMDILDLAFINDRQYLRDLESHDLQTLCDTLHALLYQFPSDVTVYCIIDGIPCFDTNRMFNELSLVLRALTDMVRDQSLVPIFKVLLATPKNSSTRVKRMLLPQDTVMLASSNIFPTEISNKLVEARLLRSAPQVPRVGQDFTLDGSDSWHEMGGYETD